MQQTETHLRLDKDWYIETDHRNWILRLERVNEGDINKKTGEPTVTKDVFYCPNLKIALKTYAHKALEGATSFDEIVSRIEQLEKQIEELCV